MALDQLTLAPAPAPAPAPVVDAPDPSDHAAFHVRNIPSDAADESAKVPRLPRWTRQEILVLIQGKRVAENRVRRGRTAGLAFGSGQVEPKWAAVSSYCKRHGVNRGAVQCRKRWSNLAGDYKKIKEWESQIKEETDSFWVMRNDLRREKKLPGFFDREVYDILDGGGSDDAGEELTLALASAPLAALPAADGGEEADAEAGVEPIFDSGRSAAADEGLFSDFEQSVQDDLGVIKETPPVTAFPPATPISGKKYQPFSQAYTAPAQGTSYEKQPSSNPETGSTQERKKRKRDAAEEGEEEEDEAKKVLHEQLIEAMERNGRLLSSHLESQNMNLQLDREERKEHVSSLISVLDKLAGALGRIADKL